MDSKANVFQTFLHDSLRLTHRAQECLRQLIDQADQSRMSPAQVRSLYQLVHSIKGTAAMVEGAERIVEELEGLESELACRPVVELAHRPEWLPAAKTALAQVENWLSSAVLKNRHRIEGAEPLVKGMLIRAKFEGNERLYWFPLTCLVRVLMPEEVAGQTMIALGGMWVPVVGEGQMGLGIRATQGHGVLLIRETVGVMGWAEAQSQGATPGLDLFEKAKKAA